ncbi:hypothetical protein C8F04DRAFT_1257498 [Mycena alexandri]|uniref:Uncharacterized protein n=1 Tax=Mycena alexandri TaxID=1745969 RepID=A0AAD6T1A6_9AGAR|nr:hypothetical protein C8F04DRAFT_1257498 [Mycena alexandri]
MLDILCFILLKGKTVNFLWNIPLSKLYSNCMMSTLNARAGFKDILAAPASGGLSAPTYPSNLSSRFPSDNKTFQTQTFGDDLRDVEYGIRMDKILIICARGIVWHRDGRASALARLEP